MLLQSCLGVDVDGWRGKINVDRPPLPRGIDEVRLHDFEIGGEALDLVFRRVGSRVEVFTDSRKGTEVPVTLRDRSTCPREVQSHPGCA
ncbi:MAG: hypothetical protein M3414_04510 [Pseudomonadota bacterium]|nr:hypothetical protein [Pseudomonadota bacterium]